jgi:hypothetical protein
MAAFCSSGVLAFKMAPRPCRRYKNIRNTAHSDFASINHFQPRFALGFPEIKVVQ